MKLIATLLKPLTFLLLFRALKDALDPPPLTEVRATALYQAEHDLHKAELAAERAVCERDMLKARVTRIKDEIAGALPVRGPTLASHMHEGPNHG